MANICAPLLARPRAIHSWRALGPFGLAVCDPELFDTIVAVVALHDEVVRRAPVRTAIIDVDATVRNRKWHVGCEAKQHLRSLRRPTTVQKRIHVDAVAAGIAPRVARGQTEAERRARGQHVFSFRPPP